MGRSALHFYIRLLFVENFAEEALFLFVVVLAERGGKFFEKLLLLCGQIVRSFNRSGEYDVALALGVDVGYSLAAHCEIGTALGSFGNFVFFTSAVEHRYLNFCSESSLREGNRNLEIDVITAPYEEAMLLYANLYNEVARRTAVNTRRALTAQNNVLSVVNSRRDINLKLLVYLDSTLAVAVLAGGLDNLASASARRAGTLGLHIAEHSLLLYRYSARSLAG